MEPSATDSNASAVLLRQTCSGEGGAFGELLEKLRPWMRVLADARLGCEVAARMDSSDVVQ